MDNKPAGGRRIHFSRVVSQTPVLLAQEGGRHAFVMTNIGSADVRVGFSGSLSTLGILVPGNAGYSDNYSMDEYWAVAASGSGTVSGFIVI
jgi:hypothetical protein